MSEIESNLAALRRKRGISAIHLAATAGISRQTIYAIETGAFVPNPTAALRLARALDCTVEELFSLGEDGPAPPAKTEAARVLPGSADLNPGQAVQLCRVDNRLIASPPAPVAWCFPAADAVVRERRVRPGRTAVQLFEAESEFTNRILVAGCDPGISVLARHVQSAGIELVLAHRNSSQSLELLKAGCIHIAGTHLQDDS